MTPEYESGPNPHENARISFADKLQELLPDVKFEESDEMREARSAVLEALARNNQEPDVLKSIWSEYTEICQRAVDSKTPSDADPQIRARFQIAILVHKALIFREIGDMQHYGEDLADAEYYALTKHLNKIAEVIGVELDTLTN